MSLGAGVALLLACAGDPAPSAPAASEVTVNDDLQALAQWMNVPDGVVTARWTVQPMGMPGGAVPGPTDTRLVAWLGLVDGWDRAGLTALDTDRRASLPIAVARQVLPPDVVDRHTRRGAELVVGGVALDASTLGRSPYEGVHAVLAGTGLLVVLQTR